MRNVLKLLAKEFAYYLSNPMAFVMLFIVPVFLAFFFGGLYSHHKVTEVKIAILDEDNTSLSRALAENFDRSEKFQTVEYLSDREKIAEYLDTNKVDAVILIPANFAKDIKRQIPVEVGVFMDGSNMLISNTVLSGANEVIQTMQAGVLIKILEGMGAVPAKAKNLVQLIQFRSRVWYNPAFNYANFLVIGLIGTVLQQITLFQTAQAFIRDRVNGQIFVWQETGMGFVTYYFAKGLFYFLTVIYNAMVSFAVAKGVFAIPLRGSILAILILTACFAAAVVTLGFLFSLIAKTEMQANQFSMVIAAPAFLISGFTWPFFAMPTFFQWVGKSIPLTHYLLGLRSLFLRGTDFSAVIPYLNVLLIMALIFTALSLLKLAKIFAGRDFEERIHESIGS